MNGIGDLQHDPNIIGHIAKPPFVQLSDPARVVTKGSERLRSLSIGHQLEAYFRFLADMTDSQLGIQPELPEPDMPAADRAARAKEVEICESCCSYVKLLYQQQNQALDPAADNGASLALDLLVREAGYRGDGINPFLLGY